MPQPEMPPLQALAVTLPASALDTVPLGIYKTDRHGSFTYANAMMLQMIGRSDWQGLTIKDVYKGKSLAAVRAGLSQRLKQRSASEYTSELTRKDRSSLKVSITGFPETDADNAVIGALVVVRDLSLEEANRKMYRLVEQEADSKKLLAAIAEALQPLVPFDRLSVIRFNEDRTHLREIYPPPDSESEERGFRWWRIPASITHLIESPDILIIEDLALWYENPARAAMLNDPAVRRHLSEGFVSTMSLPVRQDNKQMASIVLHRKGGHPPFGDFEKRLADELPLAEAVSVALRNEAKYELNFVIELMGLISVAYNSVRQVAQRVVEAIAHHYDWDHVSIYQVYEHLGVIRLIAEKVKNEAHATEQADLEMSIREGVLGRVYGTKKAAHIGNLGHSDEFDAIAIRRESFQTQSELCVPIGGAARWLLNVEDLNANAFAPEEMDDLVMIAGHLDGLLSRTLDFNARSAIVEQANDAIMLTDGRGKVVQANAATCRLLDLPLDQIVGHPIAGFFVDAKAVTRLLQGGNALNQQVDMRRIDAKKIKTSIPTLLSIASLPEDGGRVVIASDMSQVRRLEQLELAHDVYREVAAQVKTPMALAISWLRRDVERNQLAPDHVACQTIRQLQSAELTLDRMMLVERGTDGDGRHEVPVPINRLIESLLRDMPKREREILIAPGPGAGEVYVRADAYELRYCLQTIISYLVRLAAEVDRIELSVREVADEIAIALSGRGIASDEGADVDVACRHGQVRAELSLGRETLANLVGRNHGRYLEDVASDDGRIRFSLVFPVIAVGEPA